MSTYFDTYLTIRLAWDLSEFKNAEQRHLLLTTGAHLCTSGRTVTATYDRETLAQLLSGLNAARPAGSVRSKLMAAA